MDSHSDIGTFSPQVKRLMLIGAPLLALLIYFLLPSSYIDPTEGPQAFGHAGRACIAVVIWMALWWFTEAVPIAVTALIPAVMFPLLKITSPVQAMEPYASNTIFLFMGGFLLAIGVHRWGLDRRIALTTLRIVGTKSNSIIAGLLVATAFMSMWVSNTATAAMMVPIVMAILALVRTTQGGQMTRAERNFGLSVLLAIAYGASIGGMGTIIGSPPNGIYVRFMEQTYGVEVGLLQWMKVGLPIVVILLPACWFILCKVLFRDTIKEVKGGAEWVKTELEALGSMTRAEKIVAAVFGLAVFLWMFGGLIRGIEINGVLPFQAMSDAVIAMFCAMLLFCIPVDIHKNTHALTWDDCKDLSWDVLLLFGGGLSMAEALQTTGSGALIGAQAVAFAGAPSWLIILGVCTIMVFVTNFTSNTALAATMMPLLASVAPVLGVHTEVILLVTAISASAAFMMPVGTPPNAIIFSTGRITIIEMVKAGFVLSLVSIVVISAVTTLMSSSWWHSFLH